MTVKDNLILSSLLKIINYFNDHLEIQITFCILIQTQKAAIMIHDCIYQFLRIFYHSRFKPQQLEMTGTRVRNRTKKTNVFRARFSCISNLSIVHESC